ncbi:MAG: ThuA domain-containing protein, partial [Planctomycetota bacterium]
AKAAEQAPAADEVKEKKKVLFLADRGKTGKVHAHAAGNELLAKALEDSGLGFETAQYMGWPKDPKVFEGVDTVVIYCNGGKGHLVMKDLEQFQKLIDNGVGIVCMHYGVEVPKGEPGDIMLDATGGYFETHWSVNPHWTADIKTLPEHPITNGCNPFVQEDEWYFHMRFPPEMKGVTPIVSAHPPKETMKRKDGPHSNNPHVRKSMEAGEIQHLAWAYERPDGKGRGFGTTGAHYHHTWADRDWRTLILNAIAWTAGVEIPDDGVPSEDITLQKAQFDHDHDHDHQDDYVHAHVDENGDIQIHGRTEAY